MLLEKYKETGALFVYLRRKHFHITRPKMSILFEDIEDEARRILGDIVRYSTDTGFYIDGENGRETIGYAVSVEDSFDMKGIPYNRVKTIFFDEFLDYTYYEDETVKFLHIISTIVRRREDVKIYMMANTVSQFSPYFKLFGIKPNEMQQGKVAYIEHRDGVSCAVEWTKTKIDNIEDIKQKHNKYLGFDNNPTSNMILYGEWEYKETNISNVDGVTWNSQRKFVPVYFTAIEKVYEVTLKMSKNPIAFVRIINTQNGLVKESIKYNLCYDNSVTLNTHKGRIIPMYSKVSEFFDETTTQQLSILKECLRTSRVVFDNVSTGTIFTKIAKEML